MESSWWVNWRMERNAFRVERQENFEIRTIWLTAGVTDLGASDAGRKGPPMTNL